MQLLTLRLESSLNNRVTEIHRMKSENSVHCVTILTPSQIFVQIPPAPVKLVDCAVAYPGIFFGGGVNKFR